MIAWFRDKLPVIGKLLFSAFALTLLVAHIFQPDLGIDTITVVLLLLVALPWVLDRIGRLKAGDFEVDLRDLRQKLQEVRYESDEAAEAYLPAEPPSPEAPPAPVFQVQDFASLSFELRYAIESLMRQLASAASLGFGGNTASLSRSIRTLAEAGVLPRDLANALADLVPTLNRAIHGEHIPRDTLEWLAAAGRDTVSALARYVTGYVGQADELRNAMLGYVAEGSGAQVDFRLTDVRWARDTEGVWWATALVDRIDREYDQALVIMKREPGAHWIGVDFGTGMEETALPPEVRQRLWYH